MTPFKSNNFFSLFTRIWFLWSLCLIVNIIAFLFIAFKIHPSGKAFALRYNVVSGVEWYGNGDNLYFIPLAGLLLLLGNFGLFRAFEKIKSFLPLLIIFASFVVQIIVLAAVLLLARIN